MKIAFVYDRVNKMGGAERVLTALHEIWPEAPLYTAVHDSDGAPWVKGWDVRPSFLQYVPLARRSHELFAWATPFAFESFNFDEYDVVLSVTSAEAKYVITKPGTLHICYCLTPTRYLWSGVDAYMQGADPLTRFIYTCSLPTLRRWDLIGSSRPDVYVAISNRVKERIEKYYQREVEKVIYPPVRVRDEDTKILRDEAKLRLLVPSSPRYFLTVARLVGYKQVDLIIDAFNELGWPLVIVGDGAEKKRLMRMAKSNIRFVPGGLTDAELAHYYEQCRAFVFAGDEDFGIVAAEALSHGKPVVAYRESGIAEIVTHGETGILFDKQTKDSMMEALVVASKRQWNSRACQRSVERFAAARFTKEMQEFVEERYRNYTKP